MDNEEIINYGKEVIQLQSDAIKSIANFINNDFVSVVNLINSSNGRLIIMGLGKSAIIGKKIVATLNSTGCPSLFIHVVEALHGDLGNVTKKDLVLFISKSGNTEEYKKIIPIVKQMGNEIIAMTGNQDSYLFNNANYFLNTYVSKEACPNDLAPTTSTTAQLVLGDALAVCLLKMKGFSSNDFARFHPAGILGKKLTLQVKDVYNTYSKPSVKLSDGFEKIILEISSKRLGATVVVEGNNIKGIITDGDIRRFLENKKNIYECVASDLMSINPKLIDEKELAYLALNMMKKHNITQLLVVKNKLYTGIIHLHDILKEKIN
jgi:arabinose-5-phosphate isomerase